MTRLRWYFFVLGIMSQEALADFNYSCHDGQGREIGFATTSLFGFPNDPIFSLKDDSAGLDFTVMDSDFRLIEGPDKWHIIGPLNHGLYASYLATFTRVFGRVDNVDAQLKFKDNRGQDLAFYNFLCTYAK